MLAADLDVFARVCRRLGAQEVVVADDPAEGELPIEARRLVGPAHEAVGADLVDDVCVPRSRLADLFSRGGPIGQEHGVLITCAGHAGDGNMHPAVVFDPADEDMAARAEEAFGAIMWLGLDRGGTITGEHGVGLLKRFWLESELGEVALRAHRSIKQALESFNILNPGKSAAPAVTTGTGCATCCDGADAHRGASSPGIPPPPRSTEWGRRLDVAFYPLTILTTVEYAGFDGTWPNFDTMYQPIQYVREPYGGDAASTRVLATVRSVHVVPVRFLLRAGRERRGTRGVRWVQWWRLP